MLDKLRSYAEDLKDAEALVSTDELGSVLSDICDILEFHQETMENLDDRIGAGRYD